MRGLTCLLAPAPADADHHVILPSVLQEVRRFDEAVAAHREAAAICWTSVILRNPPLPEQDPEAALKIIQIPILLSELVLTQMREPATSEKCL